MGLGSRLLHSVRFVRGVGVENLSPFFNLTHSLTLSFRLRAASESSRSEGRALIALVSSLRFRFQPIS